MKTKLILTVLFSCYILNIESVAQNIPSNSIIPIEDLSIYLKNDVREDLEGTSTKILAAAFRQKFSERFFYDYKTISERLTHYNSLYSISDQHKKRANDHMEKYADSTLWLLPFDYLNGDPVNAYALRHLARQHKMVDIAMSYFSEGKDPKYIKYFENQMQSLNAALHAQAYEKIEDGNGIYESFRSGYRVLNWLRIHTMLLNEKEYSDQDQLTTIATLLQHGQHLYEINDQFRSGNHQTRGVSALAMLAILLRDFEGTDIWMDRAMLRLSEHLDREINADGFQFERSVHYHMSDINNYFYVYQLAKINGIKIDDSWKKKLRGLFTSLIKIAYPDRSAPVLQDDTQAPWAETNDISKAMTLGYLLFEDPEFGYFASNKVESKIYWFLNKDQIELLENIDQKKPTLGSLAFDDTGYFIMREGWDNDNKMMIISAGLDDKKPDHQHGDMLGIQAMANGHAILPNYQVRYSLKDFDLFKNSMVKNVALVDDELQGKQWTSNKGGSGFGKFKKLPKPNVIAWESNGIFDFFVGSHNGFENVGVDYTRQVIFVKNEFWIVKDDFQSLNEHDYKQIWQGHYTDENGSNLLRSVASDATGHDILQLHKTDSTHSEGARGKQWNVVTKKNQKEFSFLTIIYPYKGYNNRLNETAKKMMINEWFINPTKWKLDNHNTTILSSDEGDFVFNVTNIEDQNWTIRSDEATDLFIISEKHQLSIHSINNKQNKITYIPKGDGKELTKILEPGQVWTLSL